MEKLFNKCYTYMVLSHVHKTISVTVRFTFVEYAVSLLLNMFVSLLQKTVLIALVITLFFSLNGWNAVPEPFFLPIALLSFIGNYVFVFTIMCIVILIYVSFVLFAAFVKKTYAVKRIYYIDKETIKIELPTYTLIFPSKTITRIHKLNKFIVITLQSSLIKNIRIPMRVFSKEEITAVTGK